LNADENEDDTSALLLPFFLPIPMLLLLCLRFLDAKEEEEDAGDERPPARGHILVSNLCRIFPINKV
jgi:hypothetical protein